jgi:hypothetical protein
LSRFYLDTNDGDLSLKDSVGHELADRLALETLPEMARDKLPDGDRRDFICNVRDNAGTPIFTATLSLIARWLD